MRCFLLLGWLLLAGCDCQSTNTKPAADDGLVIRSYTIHEAELRSLFREFSEDDVWAEPLNGELFESRFLKGERRRGECTEFIGDVLGEEFEGRAIYDFDRGVLVVKADLRHHGELSHKLSREVIRMVRTEVIIYKGGEAGEQGKRGNEVFRQAMVTMPGQEWTSSGLGGLLEIIGESQIDETFVESRIEVLSEVEGMEFELGAGFTSPHGRPRWLGEVSGDGETLFTVEVVSDLITINGTSFYDWVRTEETGKRPGFGTRPVEEVVEEFLNLTNGKKVRRVWEVFPRYWQYLQISETSLPEGEEFDPFAADPGDEGDDERTFPPLYVGDHPDLLELKKKGALDVKELLEENGVAFRPDDFALLLEEPPTLFVQVEATSAELIEGIIMPGIYDPPYVGLCEVLLLESDVELDREAIREGEYRVGKRVGVVASGSGEFRVGDDFEGTVGVQSGYPDDTMEVKVDVKASDEGEVVDAVKALLTVDNGGLPMIISQSKGEDGWRVLAVRAWGRWCDQELGE